MVGGGTSCILHVLIRAEKEAGMDINWVSIERIAAVRDRYEIGTPERTALNTVQVARQLEMTVSEFMSQPTSGWHIVARTSYRVSIKDGSRAYTKLPSTDLATAQHYKHSGRGRVWENIQAYRIHPKGHSGPELLYGFPFTTEVTELPEGGLREPTHSVCIPPALYHALVVRTETVSAPAFDALSWTDRGTRYQATGTRAELAALGEYITVLADLVESSQIRASEVGFFGTAVLREISAHCCMEPPGDDEAAALVAAAMDETSVGAV